MTVKSFDQFTSALLEAGFSLGGGNSEGIFSLYAANPLDQYDFSHNPWHTGDPATDPWEWRMRVLDEREDVAYAKVFFRKSGFITRAWYPYFLAARRGGRTLEDEYHAGTLSSDAKRIYTVIAAHERLPFHLIKEQAHFGSQDKTRFERALVDLQMGLYISMCGRKRKTARDGAEYGWSSTVFCVTERFFGEDVFEQAARLTAAEAEAAIRARVLALNPAASPKKLPRFIAG